MFKKHIISKCKVARRNIGILKHFYPYLPLTTLDQLHKIYIRSQLDYCDIFFHLPPLRNHFDASIALNKTMEMLEKIQYQGALAITGTWQGTSRNKLYEELGWESLSEKW